ncbi:carbohydrate-binding module family 5 protein [Sphaerobolus stellatus SS14]|uniref:Carbohydrate-binding module family 5 protein n=1 Tax=Sphaerobolus stellatus (strain SS14) TaxID=990650 RepID=A0A0C9UMP4_SPHS4|nr:carbohydrate-binding module family 5 protein [Sphaerobolus stellatus SS14]
MAIRALAYALFLLSVVDATQVMRRPDDYNTQLKPYVHATATNTSFVTPPVRERALFDSSLDKRAGGKIVVGYFTNWGIYARNFQPSNINAPTLTHILYSFADVDPSSGLISLTDSYADTQKHFATDSWSETGNNLYGCLKQMYLLKMQQRNLKVLLSVGGWTYSQSGHFNFVTNSTSVANFVSSAVQLVENYGLDGIDIDFEYPSTTAQGQGLATLLGQLRTAFTQLAARKGDTTPYQITVAVSAGADNNAVGVGTWEAGVYDYKALPFSGAQVIEDMTNVASYSYDPTLKELISYDTPNIVAVKTKYIISNGMAGSMFWSLDSDKNGSASLVSTSVGLLGGLDQTQVRDSPYFSRSDSTYSKSDEESFERSYPDSTWDNIRSNMGTIGTTPSSTASGSTPTTGSCGGVAAWSSSAVYTGGQTVTYNGDTWTAKWWTQGDTPGGSADVWTDNGTCTSKRSSRFYKDMV